MGARGRKLGGAGNPPRDLLLRSPKDPSRAALILLVRDETCVAPQTGTVAVQ